MSKQKRAITAEDLTKLSIYSDPQISPAGDTYAYVSTKINDKQEYVSHIYLQEIDGLPRQWTFGEHSDTHPRFSPDGSQMVFQSTRSGGAPQLWLLSTNGGEAMQITTFKHGASSPSWSRDGKSIIFTASLDADDDVSGQEEMSEEERNKEKEKRNNKPLVVTRLKYKSDAKGFHDDKCAQIIQYDLEKKTFTQLTSKQKDHAFQDISPSGTQILFAANLNEDADQELTNDLYLLDITTNKTTKLTDGNGAYGSASFSPSGNKIISFGHEFTYSGATLNEIYVFDVESGERTCLTSAMDMQLGDAMIGDTRQGISEVGPIWSKDEKEIFFIATDRGSTALYRLKLTGELETVYAENNHIFGFTRHAENESIIIGISSPTNPGDFHLLQKEQQTKQLTAANESVLADIHLSEPEELTITAEDGWEIQGWLLRPFNMENDKKYPFVLEVHGGPHAMYGNTFFHEMQLLAAKGYVVLYTNPRGSHGYGQKFVDAVRSDYGGKDYSDLMSAVDQAIEVYDFIDTDRLGVTGGSYGGFMTNWIVGHTNRFKAAVTQRCISNWLSFYGVSDIGYFFTKWELGHRLMDDPKKLWEFSPLKYAENVETPLLILHGELDFRCPIEQGEQLFITLKQLRKEVEFVRFPGANHELSRSGKPAMRIARLNHICRWFETYL